MSNHRFKNPKNPRKFSKAFYTDDLITVISSAQSMLIEIILKEHNETPYTDIDVLIGDLHIIGVEVLNNFQTKATNNKCKPYTVEDYLNNGKLLK